MRLLSKPALPFVLCVFLFAQVSFAGWDQDASSARSLAEKLFTHLYPEAPTAASATDPAGKPSPRASSDDVAEYAANAKAFLALLNGAGTEQQFRAAFETFHHLSSRILAEQYSRTGNYGVSDRVKMLLLDCFIAINRTQNRGHSEMSHYAIANYSKLHPILDRIAFTELEWLVLHTKLNGCDEVLLN